MDSVLAPRLRITFVARALVPVLLSLTLAGCLSWSAAHDEVLRAKIEKDLWAPLVVGDPAEKIEKVLRSRVLLSPSIVTALTTSRFSNRRTNE
jgi:hypothetical protein